VAAGEEIEGGLHVQVVALGLEVRRVGAADFGAFVPQDAEPAEAVEDGLQGFGAVAFGVGIVDAEDELPAQADASGAS